MVRENESDSGDHSPPKSAQNRRQLLTTLTSSAVACGLGTASATALPGQERPVSQQSLSPETAASKDGDVETVTDAVERTNLGAELEANDLSLQPDDAALYSFGGESAELEHENPAAVIVPLQPATGSEDSSDSLFGLLCAATTTDESGDRQVATMFGIELEERDPLFSWFVDKQYSATVYYVEGESTYSTQQVSEQGQSIGTETVAVDDESDNITAMAQESEEDEQSDVCTICTLSSTLVCNTLTQLGPFLCNLACRGNSICDNICPVLSNILGEILCENKTEFCELISACEDGDKDDESKPEDGSDAQN